MSAVTQWFGPDQPPEHVGVYEVDDDLKKPYRLYAYWDGEKFNFRCNDGAFGLTGIERAYQTRTWSTCLPKRAKWRGLAVKP